MNKPSAGRHEGRKYRDALQAIEVLEAVGHAARLAGGCVRDRLLGIDPADFDVATDALPETVISIFKQRGLRAIPTGIEHGTVTLVMPHGPVEVTTLRRDLATDGRYAEVAFGRSFEEDAARRDFTINAMFEDRNGRLYDYYSGRQDLDDGILRFVGEATSRIREDYLRILRFFRFQARFGYAPAPGTLAAIAASESGLTRISQERITSELLKTISAPNAILALQAMDDCRVLHRVLPELAARGLPTLAQIAALRSAFQDDNIPASLVLAYLLLQGEKPQLTAEQLLTLGRHLRLPNRETDKIAFARSALERVPSLSTRCEQLDFVDSCEKVAAAPGAFEAYFSPLLAALGISVKAISETELLYGHRRRTRLPIDGRRLQAELGLPAGPDLGQLLELLRREFREGLWETAEQGIERARHISRS